ncbi:MAG: tetratricopeptide repeat protein [Leptolyngbya sp. SIO1E4]|nr:tetratricopeptide repeat protein [Leptolyngbya sp. SIO1E4]
MQILHLDLQAQGETSFELRYFFDNPNNYTERILPRQEIADLIQKAEGDYYVPASLQDLVGTGRRLYTWLDGTDHWLEQAIGQTNGQAIVLAISTTAAMAHLPWEVLHDGTSFLVQRLPATVPVRWVSVRSQPLQVANAARNRALQVMFMATSPRAIDPVLNYEQEEARILTATARQQLSLVVEESGSLEELGFVMASYGQNQFDGLHLTGHATFHDGQPRFITETETGDPYYASADDIAQTLQACLPPLVFLSGCRTGQAAQTGAVPSMAEALLQKGATAVLGWGQKVLDTDATEAAATLYGALGLGQSLIEALAKTYQTLLKENARDWHLLRLYVAHTLPSTLVTAPRTRGRRQAPRLSASSEFLDPDTQLVKVVGREGFVGRRRQIQACLRSLMQDFESVGVLIHGMGGLGKSALAARLCDRLTNFQRVVWVGHLDEPKLVRKLSEKLTDQALREALQNPNEALKFRLRSVLQTLTDQGLLPLLLVLDDFEANLEARAGGYGPTETAAALLNALFWAIRETCGVHRVMITSRYDFAFSQGDRLYRQPLNALRGADLQKKCDRLDGFEPPQLSRDATTAEQTIAQKMLAQQQQAKHLADGNPRLLEWLDKMLGESRRQQAADNRPGAKQNVDVDTTLARLEANPVELREQVLAATLLAQMNEALQEMLRRGLLYELPVPPAALQPLWEGIADWEAQLTRAVALGLLEVNPLGALRVPRILPLVVPNEADGLYTIAAQSLYQLWWTAATEVNEEQQLELVRLGLLAQDSEMTAEIGDRVATRWVNRSRYVEALALCRSILARFEDYRILGTVARAEQVVGLTTEAINHYQLALDRCPAEDHYSKAATLNNMAGVIAAQGNIEEAMGLWQQSLELKERINDVQGKAATLGNMAGVIAAQGNIEEAMGLWQQSLELLERINDVQGKAATLGNMAGVIAAQGNIEEAMGLWQQSLELKERINDVQGKAATLGNMARVIAAQGNIEEAMGLWQQSLELKERINDVQGKAATLNNMAGVIAAQGNIEEAMGLWQQSLELLERINDVQGKAATLNNMAGVIAAQGNIEEAMGLWQQSLELKERINDVQGKAATLGNMARVIAAQGNIEEAMGLWQQSLELLERINDVQGKAVTLANMAYVSGETGNKAHQLELNLQAAQALGQVRAFQDLFTVLTNLGLSAEANPDVYFAQALWLGLRIQTSLISMLNLIGNFFNQVPQGDVMEVSLAATWMLVCHTRGQDHPQVEAFQQAGMQMLLTAATAQGINVETPESFAAWVTAQQLNTASIVSPRLNQQLEAMVGDQWLFDRSVFG